MYLERVNSKGRQYLYLKCYQTREYYSNNKITVYSFGRIDTALKKMYSWKKDFSYFPKELKNAGCKKEDLESWIETLETGVHKKTGRKFKVEHLLAALINLNFSTITTIIIKVKMTFI
ncbi:hypothetical protein [Bacillus sp. B15-48]|uniref:hypothetical protein n=1 Tax=Bacillus sp. B15-48 TaxID=1548601 RepID=UPI00193F191D|nr:hypothetical protein [Bacillus sp. B15-48]MBM4765453.1 hypothetical protein [Bacillus sp. B15-48]